MTVVCVSGNEDHPVAVDVEAGHRPVADHEAAGTAAVVANARIEVETAARVSDRGERRVGVVVDVVGAAAAVAEERRAVGNHAVVGARKSASGADVEQRRVVTSRIEQKRGPGPVEVDGLPRLVEARRKVDLAAARVEAPAEPQVVRHVVETVQLHVEKHDADRVRGRGVGVGLTRERAVRVGEGRSRAADGVGEVLRRVDACREGRDEAPRDVRVAEPVAHLPAVGHLELRLEPNRLDDRMHAVADVVHLAVVGPVQRHDTCQINAVDGVVVGAETGERGVAWVTVAARHADWAGQVGDRTVVEILEVQPEEAPVEGLRHIPADLAAPCCHRSRHDAVLHRRGRIRRR